MKNFLINHFPSLGKYKRFWVATIVNFQSSQKSYSQHQEDAYFYDLISNYKIDPKKDIYVDVGANHPMSISNTYLFYRNGYKGVAVDPNVELIGLFKTFRKRDIALAVGCGNENTVLKFKISKTPVLSSFSNEVEVDIYEEYYCPIFTIDDLLKNIDYGYIFLLSIDVEGLNFEVLSGSLKTLREKTLLLCIEYDDKEHEIKKIMEQNGYTFLKNIANCNLVFLNTSLSEKLKKNRN
jgi:FkbM family methyltransferase